MPANNNSKQRDTRKTVTEKRTNATASFRQPGRKAIGTRLGTLDDWRGSSNKSGKRSRPHGSAMRDGRA